MDRWTAGFQPEWTAGFQPALRIAGILAGPCLMPAPA
jgi:hypothetical protein